MLTTRPLWKAAESLQLDAMAKQGMYGPPIMAPPDASIGTTLTWPMVTAKLTTAVMVPSVLLLPSYVAWLRPMPRTSNNPANASLQTEGPGELA
jgi:hypothetical protein